MSMHFLSRGLREPDAIRNLFPDFTADNEFGSIEVTADLFVQHSVLADHVMWNCVHKTVTDTIHGLRYTMKH